MVFLKYFKSLNEKLSKLWRRDSLKVKLSKSAILRPRPVILDSQEV